MKNSKHAFDISSKTDNIEHVYALPEAAGYPLTRRFKDVFGEKFIEIRSAADIPYFGKSADPVLKKKRNVLLCKKHPPFMESCPGTKNYICCGYKILSIVEGCNMDCSYCILQGYLNAPMTRVHVNIEDYEAELCAILKSNPNKEFRIGTGELADSLFLDTITGASERMINLFSQFQNAVFEVKTKSHRIDHLLDLQHNRRTIMSWSLNSTKIIREEEKRTSSLQQRLNAAAAAENAGYRIGFHFDPLIHYRSWRNDYEQVIKQIARKISPANIAWISLGCLRFPPLLWPYIRNRFPSSKLHLGEFVRGIDGKVRYFKGIREEMYEHMNRVLYNELGNDIFVYLCMESRDLWSKSMKVSSCSRYMLSKLLDQRV